MRRSFVLFVGLLCLPACQEAGMGLVAPAEFASEALAQPGPSRFLVVADPGTDIGVLAATLEARGVTVTAELPQVGLLVVETEAAAFAQADAEIEGIRSVLADPEMEVWTVGEAGGALAVSAIPPTVAGGSSLEALEWGLRAIAAPAAHAYGATGRGATVAILDAGIDADHPELAPNLNTMLSRSYVAAPVFMPPGDEGSGPAAPRHSRLGRGRRQRRRRRHDRRRPGRRDPRAPHPRTHRLPVLRCHLGDRLCGRQRGDVINRSFGTNFERYEWRSATGELIGTAREIQELLVTLSRATRYANGRGVTLVAAAGNAAIDRDHDRDGVVIPADFDFVIAVSATSPIGFGRDGATDPTSRPHTRTSASRASTSPLQPASSGAVTSRRARWDRSRSFACSSTASSRPRTAGATVGAAAPASPPARQRRRGAPGRPQRRRHGPGRRRGPPPPVRR